MILYKGKEAKSTMMREMGTVEELEPERFLGSKYDEPPNISPLRDLLATN